MFKSIKLYAAIILGFITIPSTANAQDFTKWKVTSNTTTCALLTNNDTQKIPSIGFGFIADKRSQFQILIKGNMNSDGVAPNSVDFVFGGKRIKADNAQINFLEKASTPGFADIYGLTIYVSSQHLHLFADSPSFQILLDGGPFATYALAERGQAVGFMARCMKNLKN